MVLKDVAGLKSSAIYKRSKELQTMPAFRLARFVAIFDQIFSKKKSNGASDEEAEATALSMAFAVASRFQPMPSTASLETERHMFATMAPIQFSTGGNVEVNSFDYLKANLDLINIAVAGNGFNLDHEHTEPTGTIHRILLPDDPSISAAVRAKMQKDTPFLVEASFYVDTPETIKAMTALSSEWLAVKKADGTSEVILPDSFCIAVHSPPATDETLGVSRLSTTATVHETTDSTDTTVTVKPTVIESAAPSPKAFEQASRFDATKETSPMPDEATNPIVQFEAKIASLNTELESEKKARKAAEVQASAYRIEFETTKRVIEELKSAAVDHAAETAAMTLLQDGKVTGDQVAYFAGLYKDMGREKFETLAASLPKSTLGAYAVKAANTPAMSAEAAKAQKERMARLLSEG